MGMDMYLNREKNIGTPNHEKVQIAYWRKFWDLHDYIWQEYDPREKDQNGTEVQVNKELLSKMLAFAARNKDYWDSFDTVPALCEALYDYDDYVKDGWTFTYSGDW